MIGISDNSPVVFKGEQAIRIMKHHIECEKRRNRPLNRLCRWLRTLKWFQ